MNGVKWFYLLALMAFSTGCTRAEMESAKVSFVLSAEALRPSKQTTATAGELSHLAFNVSGAGIEPRILCGLDLKNGKIRSTSGPCVFSQAGTGWQLSVDVPRGSSRLFQLITVLSGSDGGESFYYGDAVRDVQGAELLVDLPMSRLGNENAEVIHFSGQWLRAVNDAPSGTLTVSVAPGAGKPPVVLMTSSVFAGWFDGPLMQGVKFEYRLNGELMFGQGMSAEDLLALVQSRPDKIGSIGGSEYMGYFGPGSEGKKFCPTTSCDPTIYGLPWIGHVRPGLRFMGPFTSNNGPFLQLDGGTATWFPNPTLGGSVDGYSVFTHSAQLPQATQEQFMGLVWGYGDFRCEGLRSLPGFTEVVVPAGGPFTTTVSGVDSTVVVCPRKGTRLLNSAVSNQPLYGDEHGGDQTPYLRIHVSNAPMISNGVPLLTKGACYPVHLGVYMSQGPGQASPFQVTAPVAISGLATPASGAAWWSLYTDMYCASGFSGTLTIPAGSSEYSGQLYAKPEQTGSGLNLSPTITSDEGVVFHSQHNVFDVGLPVLSAHGATQMVHAGTNPICYKVTVERRGAGGGAGSGSGAPTSALTLNLAYDESTYQAFSSETDCFEIQSPLTNGAALSIAAGDHFKDIFVRRLAGTTVESLTFSAPGYVSGVHGAAGSSSSSIGSRFVIEPVNSQELGSCNLIRIRHVNAQNVEVPVLVETSLRLSSSNPGVRFASDAWCGSYPPSQQIYFSPGQSRRDVSYMAHQPSSFDIKVDSGAVSGVLAGLAPAAPSDPAKPYLTYTPPVIRSVVLGSHDGFPRVIPLTVSAGATVTCEVANSPSYYDWAPCNSNQFDASLNRFFWRAEDAVVSRGFRFLTSKNGWISHSLFVPQQFYSQWGTPFSVQACDVVLSPDQSDDRTEIHDALDTNSTVCLAGGTFDGGTATIVVPASKQLIGRTSGAGLADSVLVAAPSQNLIHAHGDTKVANLQLNPNSGDPFKALLQVVPSSSGQFLSTNNKFITNESHSYGLQRTVGSLQVKSVMDRFYVDASVGTSTGFGIDCGQQNCGGGTQIDGGFWSFTSSGVANANFARGIMVERCTVNLYVRGASNDPAASDGAFLEVEMYGDTGHQAEVTLQDSDLKFVGPDNLYRSPFLLRMKAQLAIFNSRLQSSLAYQPLIRAEGQNASNQLLLSIQNSKLIALENSSAVAVDSSSNSQTLLTGNSHFIRNTGAGNSVPALSFSANPLWDSVSPMLLSPKDTYFCGASSGTKWSEAMNASYSGTMGTEPAVSTNLDTTNMVCQ